MSVSSWIVFPKNTYCPTLELWMIVNNEKNPQKMDDSLPTLFFVLFAQTTIPFLVVTPGYVVKCRKKLISIC